MTKPTYYFKEKGFINIIRHGLNILGLDAIGIYWYSNTRIVDDTVGAPSPLAFNHLGYMFYLEFYFYAY